MPQAPGDDIRSILVSAEQRRQIRSPRIAFSDRRFFERFPHRQHRVRLASREEIDHWGELLLKGFELYTAVRTVAPGARLRVFLPAPWGGKPTSMRLWPGSCMKRRHRRTFGTLRRNSAS